MKTNGAEIPYENHHGNLHTKEIFFIIRVPYNFPCFRVFLGTKLISTINPRRTGNRQQMISRTTAARIGSGPRLLPRCPIKEEYEVNPTSEQGRTENRHCAFPRNRRVNTTGQFPVSLKQTQGQKLAFTILIPTEQTDQYRRQCVLADFHNHQIALGNSCKQIRKSGNPQIPRHNRSFIRKTASDTVENRYRQ